MPYLFAVVLAVFFLLPAAAWAEPPKTGGPSLTLSEAFQLAWKENANLKVSRLQELIWVNDDALGGSYLVNAGIHAIDVALWIAGQMPTSATGASRIVRADPHGDSHDVFSLTYEFPNGMILNHRGEHLKNRSEFRSDCIAQGRDGWLETGYTSRVRILANSGGWRGGNVVDLYPRGAERNIDAFHKAVTTGDCTNPTIEPSVNATLTTILGREAARRRTKLTLDEVLRENRRLEPDLTGLKI